MMRRLAAVVLVCVLAGGFSVPAEAQWKWRDQAGQIHLSDLPPPSDVPDSAVMQRPDMSKRKVVAAAAASASATGAASAPRPAIDPELEARMKRAELEKQAQKKKADEANNTNKAENCARAKEELRTLDSGLRLTRVNAQGEREVLDDSQRSSEAQHARDVMSSDCR